jgi:hypothetical protein
VPSIPQFRNALKGKPVVLNPVDPRFIPCMSSDDQDNRNELLMKYLSSASQSALASATGLKVTQLYNLFSNQAMLVTLCSQHNIDDIPDIEQYNIDDIPDIEQYNIDDIPDIEQYNIDDIEPTA